MEIPDATAFRVVVTTVPDAAVAETLARTLVEERLAACVNIVPGLRSIYRWKGAVEAEPELLCIIKTAAAKLDALQDRLRELHPYQVPELLAFTPSAGSFAYLAWLGEALA